MTDPQQALSERVSRAIGDAFGEELAAGDPAVRPSQSPKFGDFQANAAMGLGKKLGKNPREVASLIVAKLDLSGVCEAPPEIAGPGFINLKLSDAYLSTVADALARDEGLGVTRAALPQTIVIDYSSPNVAKEMHVGHLRSTVIGDALARTLELLGHRVVRQNHLGDWGTQFGMLIAQMEEHREASQHIADLNTFYQQAKQRFDADPGFAERARGRVVALQAGDEATLTRWRKLVEESKHHFNGAYERLTVTLADSDIRGESFYNAMLPGVLTELQGKGLATLSDGAWCVFVPGHDDPLMVQKSDGGYGYATTDLAALRFRVTELKADRVIYVVDARQGDHFAKLFHAATAAGWLGDGRVAEHVKFGTILGEDNRPFKTRTGDTVKLAALLDEAEERAMAIVREKSPELDEPQARRIARIIGIGAVKYGDLAADRVKDYVFSWSRMLAMDGNTAPYLQYAYARNRSIFRKAGIEGGASGEIHIEHEAERALTLKLAQFGGVVRSVGERLEPHHLCGWLYELATTYSRFFESCPVLRAESAEVRVSRLALCDLTARALRAALGLLGIDVVERM